MSNAERRDLAGNEIKLGNYVAYAASWSRSPILKYGIVTRLAERKHRYWPTDSETGKSTPSIGVLTVDRDFKKQWEIQREGKEIVLGFLDRLLVVSPQQVPFEALDILSKAYASKVAGNP